MDYKERIKELEKEIAKINKCIEQIVGTSDDKKEEILIDNVLNIIKPSKYSTLINYINSKNVDNEYHKIAKTFIYTIESTCNYTIKLNIRHLIRSVGILKIRKFIKDIMSDEYQFVKF